MPPVRVTSAKLVFFVGILLLLAQSSPAQPRHLYLTWEREDTARSQTIVFQTEDRATDPRIQVARIGQEAEYDTIASHTLILRGSSRRVHWVTLTGLQPYTVYKFRAGDTRYGMSQWRTFRTLPEDDRPIKVVTGGDMYHHDETVELLKIAGRQEPDVALVGGDAAYANGHLKEGRLWDIWLDNWDQHVRHPDGRMVGIIFAIGNHEVDGGYVRDKNKAPFYFGLFPQGGETYFTRKLGSEIDLIVLDSGHIVSHEEQVPFLNKALARSTAPFPVGLYHVPCYPTHRSYQDRHSVAGRQHWVPVFDKYALPVAFENHEHVFKRTHPLKVGEVVNSGGTVYLGDGCWGRDPRTVEKRWYHARVESRRHIWAFENRPSGLFCQAFDTKGEVFDEVTIGPR